jgi:hypothetical protein
MKFFRYKEVARLNFVGTDDELSNVESSYYNTKFKLFNNTEINTKLMRFPRLRVPKPPLRPLSLRRLIGENKWRN